MADDQEEQEALQALEEELATVMQAEQRVENKTRESLQSLLRFDTKNVYNVSAGKQVSVHLEAIEKALYPRFDTLCSKVSGLSEHIYSCQELADKMSCTVRLLDERQMRVQKVLAVVEDIINLKTCAEGVAKALEEGDLPDATSYVKQFHEIEGAAAKASEHYGLMLTVESRLKDTVMQRVHEAVSQSNLDDVFRFSPLLGPLGLAMKGAKIYEQFAERLLKQRLAPMAADTRTPLVQLLPTIYNTVAAFLQHHLPLVAHGFKQVNADVSLIRLVQRECERTAIPSLRRFIRSKRLVEKCRAVSTYSPGMDTEGKEQHVEGTALGVGSELDALLDELALVIQHTESYDRFVRYLAAEAEKTSDDPKLLVLPAATDLNGAVAEVSGPYTVLEYHLMRVSVRKAIDMDEAGRDEPVAAVQGQTSTCVDDSFYVLRRCARRGLVTGHAGTASAIVNYVNSILVDDLLKFQLETITSLTSLPLPISAVPAATAMGPVAGVKTQWNKVKDSIEANLDSNITAVVAGSISALGVGQGYSESDSNQVLGRLVMVNNLTACAQYTVKLQQELMAEVPSIFQDDPSTQQLVACLQDLSQTCKAFSQAAEEAVEHIATLLRPKLRSLLSEMLGEKSRVSFELDEAAFAQNQAVDPYAGRLVEFLASLLVPIADRLSEPSYDLLQSSIADFLCKRLESLLAKKTFTQLGALQLDKDLRCILAFFPSKSGVGRGVRDRFARLNQVCAVLNVDKPEDVLEDIVDGGGHGKLGHDEVLAVLQLRVDFDDASIRTVQKRMRGPSVASVSSRRS